MRNLDPSVSQHALLPVPSPIPWMIYLTILSSTAQDMVLPSGRRGPTSTRAAAAEPLAQQLQAEQAEGACFLPFLAAPCFGFPYECKAIVTRKEVCMVGAWSH